MNATMKRMVAGVSLAVLASAGLPAAASAGGATLYELTESMKLNTIKRSGDSVDRRVATTVLSGIAALGTPLCPDEALQTTPGFCAVNAIGQNDISLLTGKGAFGGTSTTMVQGDNPVDGPEAVVLRASFHGRMDFSPALLHQMPFGTVTGKVTTNKGRRGGEAVPFTGVFRLPFAGNVEIDVAPGMKATLRQVFCPASPMPNPYAPMYGGFDLAYLDFDATGVPNGKCLDIQPTELSLGTPLVRFDITF